MTAIRPMLSVPLQWERLHYPCYVSPKVDGIRCVVVNSRPLSRTAKVLPNRYLQKQFCLPDYRGLLEGLDGELVVGDPTHKEVYNKTMSGIMSQDGIPAFTYMVFDRVINYDQSYTKRLKEVRSLPVDDRPPWLTILPQALCHNRDEVEAMEQVHLVAGYEGIIVRSTKAPYKFGRSTVNQGYLLKLKRFTDAEAEIVGFEELMHNTNIPTINEQGFTSRTSHKEYQQAGGVLGALQCRLLGSNPAVYFGIGTGFDFQQRTLFWENRDKLLGKIVKFKYLPHGMLESTGAPRHPVFLGFRHSIDYSADE